MTEIYPLVAGRHGRFFVNRNDTYVGQSIRRYGEWSEPEIALFSQIVRPGDVVVEAGANIGSHTVWFSSQVGNAGSVYAFEPARHTFQLLCANLVANACLNVVALQQAVGAEVTELDFPVLDPNQSWNFGGASMKKSWTTVTERVAATTLDAMDLERVDFIKADVEGFETELLAGAAGIIAKHRPVAYIEINTAQVRDWAIAFFESKGYSCWYYITPMFSPENWLADPQDIFNDYSFDMLCVPDERFSMTGLTRAAVDDGVVRYLEQQMVWATQPWQAARVLRAAD
ncbi:MAG: Methyltransferase, FkbM family domain protein [Variovorax sp.]|nr:Methyltransferase, FkbM family domain protein [Variovorax sp.]